MLRVLYFAGVREAVGAGGKDLITAAVLAYEIQCRFCDAASLRKHGVDHVTYGAISSAVAASYSPGIVMGGLSRRSSGMSPVSSSSLGSAKWSYEGPSWRVYFVGSGEVPNCDGGCGGDRGCRGGDVG